MAAISALLYGMGGKRFQADCEKAEQLADESVRLYETAIRFLWEHIDKKSGHMKAGCGGANCRRRGIGLFSPKTCAPENHRW